MRWLIFLILLLCCVHVVRAQGDIHRCMGANGIPVFTDRVCSDVNATPVLPTPASSAASPVIATQPPPVLCAADMDQLKQAVVDAFADRNPNRLAGLTLWNGDGQQAVVANIRVFSRLMAHPLLDVETGSDSAASAASTTDPSQLAMSDTPGPEPAHGESLLLQTESEDGSEATEQTRFGVVHHAGCFWLEPRY